MKRFTYQNWCDYWAKFDDIDKLVRKSEDIDGTLISLQQEFGTKFLAGDHMLIITALEERIEYLQENSPIVEPSGQLAMFAA